MPLWTDDDQDKVHYYLAWQRARCSECGTADDEWPAIGSDDEPKWEAFTHRCPGCKELAALERTIPEKADRRGVKLMLRPFVPEPDDEDEDEAN